MSDTAITAGLVRQSLGLQHNRLIGNSNALASGERIRRALDDIASLSVSTGLQTETTGLRAASLNISQASSMLEVAGGAAGEIGEILNRMSALATQANSGALDPAGRNGLNSEFQALAEEIDSIAANTNFNGINLIDGSLESSADNSGTATIQIDDLSTKTLFNGQPLDLLSVEGAEAAYDTVSQAIGRVSAGRADIGSFQEAMDFAGSNLQSAIQNQDAARSTLTDTDIGEASTLNALLKAEQKGSIALLAQSNRLSNNLMQLLVK